MSNTATIPTHATATGRTDRFDAVAAADTPNAAIVDLLAPRPAVDINCWRLLTARVPLTLLLDLAVPSAEELAELYEELLDESAPVDWVPVPRPSRER